jgi:acyl carrier protein
MAGMTTFDRVVGILRDTLQLGDRAAKLTLDSPLLGGLPEFDSMAVVTVVTMLEDELGIAVDDDELSADVFTTVGSLTAFVSQKLGS